MTRPAKNSSFVTVETHDQMQNAVSALADGKLIAFDTEFIRERTYYPRLCLLQLANEHLVACIDVIACKNIDCIWDLLMDSSRIKIVHSARQDLELILHERESLPAPLFDTQIAAALSGHGWQISYGDLVEKELGVHLDKAHTRTDWSRRPLSDDQLEYAADDVRHLIPLYYKQCGYLTGRQRLDWVLAESDALLDESLYRVHPEQAWKKVKGAGNLSGRAHSVAQALAAWRETFAMRADRPRRWIMNDKMLLALATRQPDCTQALQDIPEMDASQVKRRGNDLLRLIGEVTKNQLDTPRSNQALDAGQRKMVKHLTAVVEQCADDLDVSKEILATRRDLEQLVRSGNNARLLDSWRRDVVGDKLVAALQVLE